MTTINRILALILLILLSPFFVLIAILIVVIDNYFPFFTARRIGLHNKSFICFKFQTLKPAKDDKYFMDPKKDHERLTKLGRFLRNRGWDELPQLINILLGQMTFIGPRPIPLSEYQSLKKRYPSKMKDLARWEKERLEVLPGLSGWHQIHLLNHNIMKYDQEFLAHKDIRKTSMIIISSLIILIIGKNSFFGEKIPDTVSIRPQSIIKRGGIILP